MSVTLSTHEILRTRLCQAYACEDEAETTSDLCAHCERRRNRGETIRLHEAPPPLSHTLVCTACGRVKDDEEFSPANDRPNRRNRHHQCKQCHRERTRLAYARQKEHARERQRKLRARQRATA